MGRALTRVKVFYDQHFHEEAISALWDEVFGPPVPPPPPPPPGWSPPYDVPTEANTSLLIGENTATDVKPASHTAINWWYALFDSFGGGVFVPGYSDGGAYWLVNTGGHNAPANVGGCGFDFADALWKRKDPLGGPTPREADYAVEETSGSPRYEITGYTNVPSPGHTYAIPQAVSAGTKGSVLIPVRQSACVVPQQAEGVYLFDLDTGEWSRASEATSGGGAGATVESQFVYDSLADRWYWIKGGVVHADQSLVYLDGTDYTFGSTASYDWPSEIGAGSYGRAIFYEDGNMLVFHRGTAMQKLNLSNIAAGWSTLSTTGTIPQSGATWVWHPTAGKFFLKATNTGDVLYTLTPPVGDPLTDDWVLDSVTIVGSGLPDKDLTTGNTLHHTGLMYVPALDLLAWVSGPGQVAIIKV